MGRNFLLKQISSSIFQRAKKKRNPLHEGFISNQQFTNSQAYWDTAASYHDEVMLRSHTKASRSQIWTFLPHWEVPVWMLTSVQVRNTCWWTISTPLLIISRLPLPPGSQALAIRQLLTSRGNWKYLSRSSWHNGNAEVLKHCCFKSTNDRNLNFPNSSPLTRVIISFELPWVASPSLRSGNCPHLLSFNFN